MGRYFEAVQMSCFSPKFHPRILAFIRVWPVTGITVEF